jgi:uncharacterized phage-associated protein
MNEKVTCFDVAKYIVSKGGCTEEKLHALLYYSQAWSLVFYGCRLFNEGICAFDTGIIIPVLYESHREELYVCKDYINGDPGKLSKQQKYCIKVALRLYGDLRTIDLVNIVRTEYPWRKAMRVNYSVDECRHDEKIRTIIPYAMRSSYKEGRCKIIKPSHMAKYCYRYTAEKIFLLGVK